MYENLNKFCEKNWLRLASSFSYWRYWDNKISITELLSIFIDPSFEYIKDNHSDKLEEACNRWTLVHSNIENNISSRSNVATIKSHTPPQTLYYRRWREWKVCNDIVIAYKEKTFVRDDIRWQVDAWTNIWPVDYKSSIRKNEKYKLQVTWYCWLSYEDKWWILYLNKDKYIFEEVIASEYMDIFLELIAYSKTILKINKHNNG